MLKSRGETTESWKVWCLRGARRNWRGAKRRGVGWGRARGFVCVVGEGHIRSGAVKGGTAGHHERYELPGDAQGSQDGVRMFTALYVLGKVRCQARTAWKGGRNVANHRHLEGVEPADSKVVWSNGMGANGSGLGWSRAPGLVRVA